MPLRVPARWRRHPAAATLLVLGVALVLFDLGRWLRWKTRGDDGGYAPRADWSAPYRGGTHYSGYVYRDRNRNGRLDVGDLPMAGVALEVTAPDGRRAIARSNLSGFVNFDMGRHQRGAAIRRPGEHAFRLCVPPGWVVTSRNVEQRSRIEELPGAPADLVSPNPIRPFGLAPALTIAGRCQRRASGDRFVAAADARVEVTGPNGRRASVPVAADGTFTTAAAVGAWQLSVHGKTGEATMVRRIDVRDAPVYVGSLVLGLESPTSAAVEPARLDFESVTPFDTAKIPSGWAGLDWDYANAIGAVFGESPGYLNTLASGSYVAYSSSGHPVTIARTGGFDLHGGYFGVAHREAEGERLRARAWRRGALVADDELVLSSLGPVWFASDYRDVDRVVLSTNRYWQFAVDDLAVSLRGGGAAPVSAAASGGRAVSAGSPSARATAAPRP